MKIYLSAIAGLKEHLVNKSVLPQSFYALESFYTMQDWECSYISLFKGFLLDSGAFTFMSNTAKHGAVDWLSYADRYADFIKENNIKHYFELDIDSIKGLQYVEMLRKRIESRSGVQCIPVWHKSRGKEYFLGMCKDYKYVALGGIASKEIPINLYERMFPWFINTAHKEGALIHGLGYTSTVNFSKYKFDSVDSTTWINGSKFGNIMEIKDGVIRQVHDSKKRCIDSKQLNIYNFKIWQRYSNLCETKY